MEGRGKARRDCRQVFQVDVLIAQGHREYGNLRLDQVNPEGLDIGNTRLRKGSV